MAPELNARCDELINRGRMLASRIRVYEGRPSHWFLPEDVPALQAWIASVANFFRLCATPDTYLMQECTRIVEEKALVQGVPHHTVQKLVGLLESVAEEMKHGLMRK